MLPLVLPLVRLDLFAAFCFSFMSANTLSDRPFGILSKKHKENTLLTISTTRYQRFGG